MSCVLDLLFSGRDTGEPRLLFKGGTSLSKAYGLISRFSEDIDITVFREDIGLDIEVGDLEGLSGKQQRLRLKATKQACLGYILGSLKGYPRHKWNPGVHGSGCLLWQHHRAVQSFHPQRGDWLFSFRGGTT